MLLDTGREPVYMPTQSGNDQIASADGACALPWFVCQTEPQAEFHALNRTAALPGVRAWLVLEVRTRECRRNNYPVFIGQTRAREEYLRPFFPGYLLVSFDPSGEAYAPLLRWNRELRTRKLLCDTAYNPLALPEGVVEALQEQGRAGDGAIDLSQPVPVLSAGDRVTVREGPFADRKVVVEWTDQQRVEVLIGMLRVSLRRGQVS